METIKYLNKWANAHTYYPLDFLRVLLGAFLFYKGLDFISHSAILMELTKPMQNWAGGMLTIHYVAPAHLIGGILIVFGLLTRWAILSQLPILIGAVVINFVGEFNSTNFLMASITLLICVFFLVYGSGKTFCRLQFKNAKLSRQKNSCFLFKVKVPKCFIYLGASRAFCYIFCKKAKGCRDNP